VITGFWIVNGKAGTAGDAGVAPTDLSAVSYPPGPSDDLERGRLGAAPVPAGQGDQGHGDDQEQRDDEPLQGAFPSSGSIPKTISIQLRETRGKRNRSVVSAARPAFKIEPSPGVHDLVPPCSHHGC
jgi:hypothetical protein